MASSGTRCRGYRPSAPSEPHGPFPTRLGDRCQPQPMIRFMPAKREPIICHLMQGSAESGAGRLSERLAYLFKPEFSFIFAFFSENDAARSGLETEGFPVHVIDQRTGSSWADLTTPGSGARARQIEPGPRAPDDVLALWSDGPTPLPAAADSLDRARAGLSGSPSSNGWPRSVCSSNGAIGSLRSASRFGGR